MPAKSELIECFHKGEVMAAVAIVDELRPMHFRVVVLFELLQ